MTDAQLKTYLDSFSADTGTGDVKRELFIIYAKKTGESSYTPLGYKQESAAIENNYNENSVRDILGSVYNDIISKDEQISMSEYHINPNASAFLNTAWMYTLAGLESELEDYELLMVSAWLKKSGAYFARQVQNVRLKLDNMGGQSFSMADVTFSGISRGKFGTVSDLASPSFTEGTVSNSSSSSSSTPA